MLSCKVILPLGNQNKSYLSETRAAPSAQSLSSCLLDFFFRWDLWLGLLDRDLCLLDLLRDLSRLWDRSLSLSLGFSERLRLDSLSLSLSRSRPSLWGLPSRLPPGEDILTGGMIGGGPICTGGGPIGGGPVRVFRSEGAQPGSASLPERENFYLRIVIFG